MTGFSIGQNWQIAYYLAAYRLLFPISVLFAAWRFRVKGGLIVCAIIGPVILASTFVNSRWPTGVIDFADIAVGLVLSWLVGRQAEIKQCLEAATRELEHQSMQLKTEIADRKQAEEKYKLIAGHTADIIYKLTIKEQKLNYISPSVERLLGYTEREALALKLTEILTPESYKKQQNELIKDIQQGVNSNTLKLDIIHKNGQIIPFEVRASLVFNDKGEPSEIVGVARDISERKTMAEQLIVQDRLASIGQLTSSLALELNNPLTSIISLSSLLTKKPLPEDVQQDLTAIHDEAQRITGIVRNLQSFTRKQPQEKQPTDINACIREVLKMRAYEHQINNIQVNTLLDPSLPFIMGNAPQLEQVFFNIVINAEYFMTETHQKGVLNITTERADGFIRAIFADNGPGLSESDLRQIFTPFFTTKKTGKGMGLSLNICQGIVTEHGGRLAATSEPGKGATFTIEFPIINE